MPINQQVRGDIEHQPGHRSELAGLLDADTRVLQWDVQYDAAIETTKSV